MTLRTKILFSLLLLYSLSFVQTPFLESAALKSDAEIPTEMTDFVLYDVTGKTVTLSREKGEGAVLLVFWAMWSQESKKVVRELQEIVEKYEALGVKVLTINVDRNTRNLSYYAQENGLSFTILKDPKGIFEDRYGVTFIPTNILIDKEDRIVYRDSKLPDEQGIASLVRTY